MSVTKEELISTLDKMKWELCDLFENQDDIALVINDRLETVKKLEEQLGFVPEHPFNIKSENITLCN